MHTKEPWKATRIGSNWTSSKEKGMCFRIEAPEANTPKRWDVAVTYYKPEIEEAEANARLISAAPELLEALEIALKIIEGEDLDEKYNEVCIIQDAIAKAKGQ